ncbi:RNA helicase [Ranunculus cassubicifolius]
MGINNLLAFEFIDPPSPHFINYPMRELYNLGALDEDGKLTEMGRLMSGFSIEPSLSKMLTFSALIGCSEEIMTIIAMLRLGNIFYRPCGKELVADERRAHFIHPEGDHLTLLAVYNAWMANGFSFEWCLENFVQYRLLRKAFNVRQGLMGAMNMLGLEVASDGENSVNIRRAIVAGLSCNAAKREQNVGYRTLVGDRPVYIHGDSALYQRQPDWVVYSDVASIEGNDYIREVTTIEPGWLIELAPQCFRVTNQ